MMFASASPHGQTSRGGTARRPETSAIPRLDVGGFGIELRGPLDLDAIAAPWTALARRALVPSPFAEHALLAAAARHLPEGRQLQTLLVWSGARLVGVAPVTSARSPLGAKRLAPWRVDFLPAATPLLDAEAAGPVLDAMLRFARARGTPLVLADAPVGSALAHFFRAAGLSANAPAPALEPEPDRSVVPFTDLAYDSARTAAEVRDAVEVFLALDVEAAAAQRRHALVQDPGHANLVRTATRRAARERSCRVAIARRDGAAVAAAILVRDHAWLTVATPAEEPALAALLARRPLAPAPVRNDWSLAPSAVGRPGLPARGLLAAARRLIAPLPRAT
ncbi:GNAT family N-acetyltransferase [Salinarimonas rosea]|uniref:GNAT family N-acetyltransferase n=1 Tax=Salinarimonas rosea TaxID=552063 RepID=UPI000414C295|nr:GNAT family N-acetyltransferase [Salinarimonas rosea]